MAFLQLISVIVVVLAFLKIELTVCSSVKGLVLCTDCDNHYDYSGIYVLVKCDKVQKQSMAITDGKGAFETNLPSNVPTSQSSTKPNCLAKLLGGMSQIYALKQNMVSEVVATQGDENTYTVLTPLVFSQSCHGECGSGGAIIGSSKTIDLPIPPQYGLPPTSYYFPFMPIIGIP